MRPTRGHDAGFMIIRPADCFLWRIGSFIQSVGDSQSEFPIDFYTPPTSNTRSKLPIKTSKGRVPEIWLLNFVARLLQTFFTTNSPEFRCCDTFRSPIQSITKLELTGASVIDHIDGWTHTLWLNLPNKRRYMPRMEKLVCTV